MRVMPCLLCGVPNRSSICPRCNKTRGYASDAYQRMSATVKEMVSVTLARGGRIDCYLCGDPVELMSDVSIEHIVPLSRGGVNELRNMAVAHRGCNYGKR